MKMLKVDRTKEKISLSLRPSTELLTKEFKIALAIALSLHLMAAFVFHVDLGVFFEPSQKSLSAKVGTSLKSTAIAEPLEKENLSLNPMLAFKRESIPNSPQIPLYSEKEASPILKNPIYFDTYSMENGDFKKKNGKLHLSKGYQLKSTAPLNLSCSKSCKASLNFQAFTSSGAVIWLEWVESTGDMKLDHQIENYLKQIRLDLPTASLIAEGKIEVEFS